MGKSQRRKGHQFERDTANRYQEAGYSDARRRYEDRGREAEKQVDLMGTHPFAIQCKFWKKYPPINKIEDIEAEDDEIPVYHAKGNYKKPVVVLYEKDWLELVEALKAEGIF